MNQKQISEAVTEQPAAQPHSILILLTHPPTKFSVQYVQRVHFLSRPCLYLERCNCVWGSIRSRVPSFVRPKCLFIDGQRNTMPVSFSIQNSCLIEAWTHHLPHSVPRVAIFQATVNVCKYAPQGFHHMEAGMASSKVAWNKDRGTPLCLLAVYSLIFFQWSFVSWLFHSTGQAGSDRKRGREGERERERVPSR